MGSVTDDYISGIFLDFDNIYSSLHKANPGAAVDFATSPSRWLGALESMGGVETDARSHRFVIRRCYMNPVGHVPGSEVSFSNYRQSFVRDGWEVIDTPPLTNRGKTSADIHIVMDVLDAVHYYPHVIEYIIMAADADFTPLITRLRKHLKKTIVYGALSTAAAYRAACDSIISEADFIELFSKDDEHAELTPAQFLQGAQTSDAAAPAIVTHLPPATPERVSQVVKRYFDESAPDHRAQISTILRLLTNEFGPLISADWMGHQSPSQFLRKVCGLEVQKIENRTLAWVPHK